jgi:hypothetical protein
MKFHDHGTTRSQCRKGKLPITVGGAQGERWCCLASMQRRARIFSHLGDDCRTPKKTGQYPKKTGTKVDNSSGQPLARGGQNDLRQEQWAPVRV